MMEHLFHFLATLPSMVLPLFCTYLILGEDEEFVVILFFKTFAMKMDANHLISCETWFSGMPGLKSTIAANFGSEL